MDSNAVLRYSLLLFFGGGTVAYLAYLIWGYASRGKFLLRQWAESNGFEILDSKFCFGGPFGWTSSRWQIVYTVRIRGQDGQERRGWVRCGSFWAGVFSDKTEVRWMRHDPNIQPYAGDELPPRISARRMAATGTRPSRSTFRFQRQPLSVAFSKVEMKSDVQANPVRSPWGSVAAVCLMGCFGFVALQGFRMFVSIAVHGSDPLSGDVVTDLAGRVMVSLQLPVWIIAFIIAQKRLLHFIADFEKGKRAAFFVEALRNPYEVVKLGLALLFGSINVLFFFGYYPFPSRPITTIVSLLFAIFGWGVPSLLAWLTRNRRLVIAQRNQPQGAGGNLIPVIFGGAFFALGCFHSAIFYFAGMIGLGFMTLGMCDFLVKTAGNTNTEENGMPAPFRRAKLPPRRTEHASSTPDTEENGMPARFQPAKLPPRRTERASSTPSRGD